MIAESKRDPFWERMREDFKKYMMKNKGMKEEVAERKAEEFSRFYGVWNELLNLIHKGSFDKNGRHVLGIVNAYELTQEPYSLSNMAALSTLYDMITKGPECEAFKFCYTNKIASSDNPEKTAAKLDKIIAEWTQGREVE